jgi:hypothetical protein
MVPFARSLVLVLLVVLPAHAVAERLRIATYDPGLTRDGAGVLLRDLERAPDGAVAGAVAVIQATRPDILLLTGFDHDPNGRALAALLELLREGPGGIDYPYSYNGPVNAGEPSGLDLDGDGMRRGWGDGWGWGKFPGHGGMAILSRLPLDTANVRTFNTFLWRDLPFAGTPVRPDGNRWPDDAVAEERRLSSKGHWEVPVELPGGGALHLLASNPTPPLFDGPEGANVKRNRDEIRFWAEYLAGHAFTDDQGRTAGPPPAPIVVLGNLNKDPDDGAGAADGISALLESDRIRDVKPASHGAALAVEEQGGANVSHKGAAKLDTADWNDERGPGNLRVDYVLPDAALRVAGSGVFWPYPGSALAEAARAASAHRLVWVDVVPR